MLWSQEASLEVPHGNLDAPAPQSVRTDGWFFGQPDLH